MVVVFAVLVDLGIHVGLGQVSQTVLGQQLVDTAHAAAVIALLVVPDRGVHACETFDFVVDNVVHRSLRKGIVEVEFGRDLQESGVVHRNRRSPPLGSGVFRGDDDHAVCGLGAPDRGSRGVLKDRDALHVVGVDRLEATLDGEAVDDQQGLRGRRGEARTSADLEYGVSVCILRAGETCHGTDESAGDVARGFFDLRLVNDVKRTCRAFLGDGLVSGHHDILEVLDGFQEFDVHGGFLPDFHLLGVVSQALEQENVLGRSLNAVISVRIGCRTGGRSLDGDSDADYGGSCLVGNLSCDPMVLREGRQRKETDRKHRCYEKFLHTKLRIKLL